MNRTSLTNSRNALTLLINEKRNAGILRNVTANNLLSRVPTMHKKTADNLFNTLLRTTAKTTLAKLKKNIVSRPAIRVRQPEQDEMLMVGEYDYSSGLERSFFEQHDHWKISNDFFNQYLRNAAVDGVDVSVRLFGRLDDNNEYTPDYTFNRVLNEPVVVANWYLRSRDDFKKAIMGAVCEILRIENSANAEKFAGSIKLIQAPEPEWIDQMLQYAPANSNCFFNTIRRSISHNKKLVSNLSNVIDRLEAKYATGVPMTEDFSDIKYILKCLWSIDIAIFDKLGKTIFTSHVSNNKKFTVRMTLERLNHVIDYEDFSNTKSNKTIVYCDDIDKAFNEHNNTAMFDTMKDKDNKDVIKVFWSNTNIYKRTETKDYDMGLCHINSTDDKAFDTFLHMNNINEEVSKNHQPELYNFINSSVHNVDCKYFPHKITEIDRTETDIDLSTTFNYDMNKAYASYTSSPYYAKHKFPASSKFNFYNVVEPLTDEDIQVLLTKTGFVQINHIYIPNKSVGMLRYFKPNFVYPMPAIQWLIDNNCSFNIKRVAFNVFKQDINFTDDMILNKQYSKIIGKLHITNESKRYNIKCMNESEAKFLSHTSGRRVRSYKNNSFGSSVTITEPKTFISNFAHIGSYFLAYSILSVLDKVKQIDSNDLFGVHVDCVKTYKDYSHIFDINTDLGGWKILEKDGNYHVRNHYTFVDTHISDKFKVENNLTSQKLRLNKINLVQGVAGSGKTTTFLSSLYGERLYNVLATFPNNELTMKFNNEKKSEYDGIKTSTYHMAFNIMSHTKVDKNQSSTLARYYNYAIVDEATMLSIEHFKLILKYATDNHIILLLAGDYDFKTKQLFQMKPIESRPFLDYKFNNNDIYEIKKTKSYRHMNDFKFRLFANECRGKTNDEILQLIKSNKIFNDNFVSYDDMINSYDCNKDVILSTHKSKATNTKVNTDTINKILFDKNTIIKAKYNTTTKSHAKNQDVELTKQNFDAKKYDLSFAITSHLCQGKEYDEDKTIYIMLGKYFEDNQLYVLLTRAKTSKQIKFVKPN